MGETARDSFGSAFEYARHAVTQAKKTPWRLAVAGVLRADDVEAALALLVAVVESRTPRGQDTVRLKWETAGSDEDLANRLDVTRQAVQQRLRAAHYPHEVVGRDLVDRLLQQADGSFAGVS